MSYNYVRRSSKELREIAHGLLERFKAHRYAPCAVDIEKIQEDLGFEIIYRSSLGLDGLKGYTAYDARYLVVSDFASPKDIRYTISHEVSHKILEFDIWKNGEIPDGAHCHELTVEQHKDIEENAWELAAELLEPFPAFVERYNIHHEASQKNSRNGLAGKYIAVLETAKDFDVITRAAALRAKRLGLLTADEHKQAFEGIM